MQQQVGLAAIADPLALVPRSLASAMRPELDSLAEEIIAAVRHEVPEYARPMEGPYGHSLRIGVREAITAFVDQVADPSAPHDHLHEVCHWLGQTEAREGRTLDALQAAYRIGSRLAWVRITQVAQRQELSPIVVSLLAQGLFGYMDELARNSERGHADERRRSADVVAHWREQLLRLILEIEPGSWDALAEIAQRADWPLPDEVTAVAVHPGPAGAAELPGDALADLDAVRPHLLLPGGIDTDRGGELAGAFPGGRLVVGPRVPLHESARSLAWARRLLAAADSGVTGDDPMVYCEDHLLTLLLLADEPLVEQIAGRQLAPLAELPDRQRTVLGDTLAAWLATRGDAQLAAERLTVHPQTVRYRKRQLDKLFGDRLDDPRWRLLTQLALHGRRVPR